MLITILIIVFIVGFTLYNAKDGKEIDFANTGKALLVIVLTILFIGYGLFSIITFF